MSVTKSSQLIVQAPDKAGELAKVLGAVAGAKINILAYAGWSEGSDKGFVMLVTADNAKAASLLKGAGYQFKEQPVVVVTDADVVGRGAALAKKIADAGISLTGAFATCAGGNYTTVYSAADTDKLAAALK